MTTIRSALLDVLAHAKKPLSVPDLLKTLAQRGLNVNKTTLYRNLEEFIKQGIAIEVRLNERQMRYELADQDHHHHLVCTSCDKIEDIKLKEDFKKQERAIEKRTKFKIQRHALEFFGLCHACQTA